jgi:anti-anti-sigma regulatory factor
MTKYRPRVLALDMSRVLDIEYSALKMLMEAEQRGTAQGAIVWVADLSPRVRECFESSGFAARLGKDRLFFNARAVIRHYQDAFASAAPGP